MKGSYLGKASFEAEDNIAGKGDTQTITATSLQTHRTVAVELIGPSGAA